MDENPKYCNNGCLGAKLRIGVCQTAIPGRLNRNRSRASMSTLVGEIPLNRNGIPSI